MKALRVLIVDDSSAMRSMIHRVLEMSGVPVDSYAEAANGSDALKHIGSSSTDLVVCDVNMPVMNGEEFLTELRVRMPERGPQVLVVSTDFTHQRVERMLRLGAAAYLKKPFTPEDMREAIDKVTSPMLFGSHSGDEQ